MPSFSWGYDVLADLLAGRDWEHTGEKLDGLYSAPIRLK